MKLHPTVDVPAAAPIGGGRGGPALQPGGADGPPGTGAGALF